MFYRNQFFLLLVTELETYHKQKRKGGRETSELLVSMPSVVYESLATQGRLVW